MLTLPQSCVAGFLALLIKTKENAHTHTPLPAAQVAVKSTVQSCDWRCLGTTQPRSGLHLPGCLETSSFGKGNLAATAEKDLSKGAE